MARFVKFDTFSDILFSLNKFKYSQNGTNSQEYKKILKILKRIIRYELTLKQRQCLDMYYRKNMNTIEISRLLGVYPSTVWRHIQRSKKKIKNIIQYYHEF